LEVKQENVVKPHDFYLLHVGTAVFVRSGTS